MMPINQINIGDFSELGKLITPEKAEQFQKDIEMYNRIIKILESK